MSVITVMRVPDEDAVIGMKAGVYARADLILEVGAGKDPAECANSGVLGCTETTPCWSLRS